MCALFFVRLAECNSAIQQIKNLRYAFRPNQDTTIEFSAC